MQAIKDWVKSVTEKYQHVEIENFSSSWSNGMAFCAVVHSYFPDAFDYSSLNPKNRKENLELAFSTAEKLADCPIWFEMKDEFLINETPDPQKHVEIKNFSSSWSNGMAFCAVVHSYFPNAFDYSSLNPENKKENFELAFSTAEKLANCDPWLKVEEILAMGSRPDSTSVFVYLTYLKKMLIKASHKDC